MSNVCRLQLYESVRKELGTSALSFISDLQCTFFERFILQTISILMS